MTTPVTVTVTGAAGQIGYALLFRIASGHLLGAGRPGEAAAAGDPAGAQGRRGHRDGARRLRLPAAAGHRHHRRPRRPPSTAPTWPCWSAPGRAPRAWSAATCSSANGGIFGPQGKAINDHAADDIKVLVVGNPANTNALIAQQQRPGRPADRFTAMTRLDHNRASPSSPRSRRRRSPRSANMTIWGNHSATQYPDLFHAEVGGKNAAEAIDDQAWLRDTFIPTVAKRGAAIIEARGASSAASAANAALDHVLQLGQRHRRGRLDLRWRVSDGSYGVPEGLISSFPCHRPGRRATRSSRAWRSTTSPAAGSTPPSPSWPPSATPSVPST